MNTRRAISHLTVLVLAAVALGCPTRPPSGPTDSWSKLYHNGDGEVFLDVVQTTDGGYIACGADFENGDCLWVVKSDAAGKRIWGKSMCFLWRHSAALSVRQASDGGYVLAGRAKERNLGCGGDYFTEWDSSDDTWDLFLLKLTAGGSMVPEWVQVWHNPEKDSTAYCVRQTSDGGYVVAGGYGTNGSFGGDLCLLKTDGQGNEEWFCVYSAEAPSKFSPDIILSTVGGYTLATEDTLLRTDAQGTEQWRRALPHAATSVVRAIDGGYVVLGSNALTKVDPDGNEVWSHSNSWFGYHLQQVSDGGYVLVSHNNGSPSSPAAETRLIRTDANGQEQWTRNLPQNQSAFVVRQTKDGGFVLAGCDYNPEYDMFDTLLIKTKASGEMPPRDSRLDWVIGQIWGTCEPYTYSYNDF